MNVHLLRSPELKTETYRNVLNLLQQFRGPIYFQECEEEVLLNDSDAENEIEWKNKKDFETTKMITDNGFIGHCLDFPYHEKVKTWEQLFAACDKYRTEKKISEDDIVVLLTDVGNDLNWFGAASSSMKNYFIQTSNWEYFFGNDIDIRFPIAYEVIVWVMRKYMFVDNNDILDGVHLEPIGCIMDFCEKKSQIILKMRTADVCESCMKKFIERDVALLFTRQFFEILDGIRKSMTFRGRAVLLQQPSRIEIRGQLRRIFFKDLGRLELKLNPKEKSLFLLFLNHSEGMFITHLQDHRTELMQLYTLFNNQASLEKLNQAIDVLINPLENDINVVLSRINKKIKDSVGDYLYDFYCINGIRGEIKRIKLDRELVIFSNN